MAINALEDLWNNCKSEPGPFVLYIKLIQFIDEEAKASVRPYLARVRPAALGDQTPMSIKKESSSTPIPQASTPAPLAAGSPPPAKTEMSPKPVVAAG